MGILHMITTEWKQEQPKQPQAKNTREPHHHFHHLLVCLRTPAWTPAAASQRRICASSWTGEWSPGIKHTRGNDIRGQTRHSMELSVKLASGPEGLGQTLSYTATMWSAVVAHLFQLYRNLQNNFIETLWYIYDKIKKEVFRDTFISTEFNRCF